MAEQTHHITANELFSDNGSDLAISALPKGDLFYAVLDIQYNCILLFSLGRGASEFLRSYVNSFAA